MKRSVYFIVLRYLRLSYALDGTFFLEKYDFFNEIFQVGACPNLKDSLISICTRHDASGFFDCFALSATLLCLVRYICFEKEIFQEFCCCIVVLRPQ